jgi:hypothetical protein
MARNARRIFQDRFSGADVYPAIAAYLESFAGMEAPA